MDDSSTGAAYACSMTHAPLARHTHRRPHRRTRPEKRSGAGAGSRTQTSSTAAPPLARTRRRRDDGDVATLRPRARLPATSAAAARLEQPRQQRRCQLSSAELAASTAGGARMRSAGGHALTTTHAQPPHHTHRLHQRRLRGAQRRQRRHQRHHRPSSAAACAMAAARAPTTTWRPPSAAPDTLPCHVAASHSAATQRRGRAGADRVQLGTKPLSECALGQPATTCRCRPHRRHVSSGAGRQRATAAALRRAAALHQLCILVSACISPPPHSQLRHQTRAPAGGRGWLRRTPCAPHRRRTCNGVAAAQLLAPRPRVVHAQATAGAAIARCPNTRTAAQTRSSGMR